MDILGELSKKKTILLLMPSAGYNDLTIEIAKKLSQKNVCYITLNKTFDSLKETFSKNKVNVKNIVFIDAISKTIKSAPDQTDGCYYVSSPAALTELSILATKFLRHNFDYIVFDSITNLLVYTGKAPVAKFISSFTNKIRETNSKAVFYALSINEQEELIRECAMFVDGVVDLGKGEKKG